MFELSPFVSTSTHCLIKEKFINSQFSKLTIHLRHGHSLDRTKHNCKLISSMIVLAKTKQVLEPVVSKRIIVYTVWKQLFK